VKESLFVLPDISDFFLSCHLRKNDYFSNHLYTMAKQTLTFVLLVAFVSAGCGPKDESPKNYSEKVAKDFIQQVPNPVSIHWETDPNHFSWQAGYIMFAMERMWRVTGDSVYFNYVKRYVDQQVDENGNLS